MTTNLPEDTFGYYAPDRSTLLLQAITKLGISRGSFRKWIAEQWIKKGHSIVDATIRGINYRLHLNRNNTDNKILTSSKFYDEKEISSLASALKTHSSDDSKPETTFLDIGANTGYYSLNLARLGYSKVIAIEPNPPTLDILWFNIKANHMEPKISVIPMCIGSGEAIPFYCSTGLGSASVFKDDHNSKPILVQSKPLLEILEQENVKRVDGMKIDIEGFEDRALFPFFDSAPSELWPRIVVIEDCHRHIWENDILNKMKSIGYAVEGNTRGNQILKLTNSAVHSDEK